MNDFSKRTLKITPQKVRIIAHCIFDGWLYSINCKYAIGYCNKNTSLMNKFVSDINELYGIFKKPRKRIRKSTTYEVEFFSKKMYNDIRVYISNDKSLTQSFFRILKRKKYLIKLFLRAFWDDEGTVSYCGSTRKLRGRCSNKLLRKQLLMLHKILGIVIKEDYDNLGLIICNYENLRIFNQKIGFSKNVFVCKSNKIGPWFGYEKRKVLNNALNSYNF